MSSAGVRDLLGAIRAAGLIIEVDGDGLRYRPRQKLSPQLRALIVEHKAELMAALRDPPDVQQLSAVGAGSTIAAPGALDESEPDVWPDMDHSVVLSPGMFGPIARPDAGTAGAGLRDESRQARDGGKKQLNFEDLAEEGDSDA